MQPFVAAAAALLLGAAHAAVLTSVSPSRGSLAGGTELTLKGAGFSRGGVEVCVCALRNAPRGPLRAAPSARASLRLCVVSSLFIATVAVVSLVRRRCAVWSSVTCGGGMPVFILV
jgi:hypothetical protein